MTQISVPSALSDTPPLGQDFDKEQQTMRARGKSICGGDHFAISSHLLSDN
jgi:hypothetical protein